jgi:TonB-linked SusC/RagA family outer membrane protein
MKKLLLVSLCFLVLSITQVFAQSRTVTGTVRAKDDGQPIPGVTVKIKGTAIGTQTNAAGKFTISVPPGAILQFSFIGYANVELPASDPMVVNLGAGNSQLNEVVVTALNIKRDSKTLGYSTSTIKPAQILQKSEPNLLKSLEGKVAGVDIQSSDGTPGAAARITIRGNSSFLGNNQPLFVVDGIPYSNDQTYTSNAFTGGGAYGAGIGNLDQNDIASITILKGTDGAALYGSRASNGVVVITTKSGSASRSKKGMEVTYRGGYSMEKVAKLPDYQNDYGTGAEGFYEVANGSWGQSFATLDSVPAFSDYLANYPQLFSSDGMMAYRAFPNNVADLFKTGGVWENSVSISGGDEKNAVSATGSQVNQTGYLPNTSYVKSSFSVGGSSKLDNGVNVSANLSYTRSTQLGGFFGENQDAGDASEFARTLVLARNWDTNLPYQDLNGNSITWNGGGQYDNPTWSALNNTINTADERIIADFRADKDIVKWLNLSFTFGDNTDRLDRREVIEVGSRAAAGLGSLTVDDSQNADIESNALLTFKPTLPGAFTLKGIAGFDYYQETYTDNVEIGNIFITRGIHELSNTSQQIFPVNGDYYSRQRIFGALAEADLGYHDWAFLTLTGRNDRSSTLPVNARSYFYYSANGSLVFTDALKIKSDVFDFGKIRIGYSKVGNGASPYENNNVYYVGSNFLGQNTGYFTQSANNPNLTPEFSKEVELGTQLGFFQDRLGFDFTFYNKNSYNQIAPLSVAPSTGFTSYVTNFGSLNNRGYEIELTGTPIKSKDFNWNIEWNFSKNRSIVTSLTDGVPRVEISAPGGNASSGIGVGAFLEPGMPYGYLRGTVDARDSKGNLLINPSTGAQIESPNQGYIGDPSPKFITGLTNTFTYKGFSLSIQVDAKIGGDIYSETVQNELGRGVIQATDNRTTSFVIPGVYGNSDTYQPTLVDGKEVKNTTAITANDVWFQGTHGGFATNGAAEWSVYDATVYRLREVDLGYTFPKSMYQNLPVGSIRITLTGNNLWYFAPNIPKSANFDPETNSFGATNVQGIEASSAPSVRRYGVNLSVTF